MNATSKTTLINAFIITLAVVAMHTSQIVDFARAPSWEDLRVLLAILGTAAAPLALSCMKSLGHAVDYVRDRSPYPEDRGRG
jgi:hypothetical protein